MPSIFSQSWEIANPWLRSKAESCLLNRAWGKSADAAFQVDLFGRLRRATEAARAQLLATDAARQTVILTLVSDARGVGPETAAHGVATLGADES
jgi:outer membrane protein TolC